MRSQITLVHARPLPTFEPSIPIPDGTKLSDICTRVATSWLFAHCSMRGRYSYAFLRGSLRRHGEAAIAHQCIRVEVAAAELAEGDVGRDRVADAHDVITQPFRDRPVIEVLRFLERLRRVGGQRIGPYITIVAGRVAVVGEDVLEGGRAMTHHDLV